MLTSSGIKVNIKAIHDIKVEFRLQLELTLLRRTAWRTCAHVSRVHEHGADTRLHSTLVAHIGTLLIRRTLKHKIIPLKNSPKPKPSKYMCMRRHTNTHTAES